MARSVFDYRSYKAYLNDLFETSGKTRGLRARLAEALQIQSAFISKVLKQDAHFSLEHAAKISEFLEHTAEEEHQFLLLVHLEKAGTKSLERYYQRQLEEIRKHRREIKKHIVLEEDRPLSHEEQAIYYSSWHYIAIHVLVSVKEWSTLDGLVEYFKLKPSEIKGYLEFLTSTGILKETRGRYEVGARRMHLGKESVFLNKHHMNWRLRALDALDRKDVDHLHYSSIISFAIKDIEKIRELLMQTIHSVDGVMKPSPEETAFCFAIDFFKV